MAEYDDLVAILKRMELNQLKALDMQAEQLARIQAQTERADARFQESVAIQQATVSRYARITRLMVPIMLAALMIAFYVMFAAA